MKTNFTAADVEARACEALRLGLAHGIGAMRAQCDVDSFTELRSLEGLLPRGSDSPSLSTSKSSPFLRKLSSPIRRHLICSERRSEWVRI